VRPPRSSPRDPLRAGAEASGPQRAGTGSSPSGRSASSARARRAGSVAGALWPRPRPRSRSCAGSPFGKCRMTGPARSTCLLPGAGRRNESRTEASIGVTSMSWGWARSSSRNGRLRRARARHGRACGRTRAASWPLGVLELSLAEVRELWEDVVQQVEAQGLALGVYVELPREKGGRSRRDGFWYRPRVLRTGSPS
jgi:hypothetical protein